VIITILEVRIICTHFLWHHLRKDGNAYGSHFQPFIALGPWIKLGALFGTLLEVNAPIEFGMIFTQMIIVAALDIEFHHIEV